MGNEQLRGFAKVDWRDMSYSAAAHSAVHRYALYLAAVWKKT